MTTRGVHAHATWICRSLKPLLDVGASGVVRHVSDRAIDIETAGRLFGLVASGSGRLPGGIGLDLAHGLDEIGLRIGDVVWMTTTGLTDVRPASRTRGQGHLVSFETALQWDATMTDRRRRPTLDRLAQAWCDPATSGLGNPAVDPWRAWGAIENLGPSLMRTDIEGALGAAFGLIGRGPGLTPSGDDLLVGCGAALTAFGHPIARDFTAGVASLARGRTTRVAEAYHEHAAAGRYGEHLRGLIDALAEPDADIAEAVARARSWGATSGLDGLLGLLIGAESCL